MKLDEITEPCKCGSDCFEQEAYVLVTVIKSYTIGDFGESDDGDDPGDFGFEQSRGSIRCADCGSPLMIQLKD